LRTAKFRPLSSGSGHCSASPAAHSELNALTPRAPRLFGPLEKAILAKGALLDDAEDDDGWAPPPLPFPGK
jgi:hypothetical protein